MNTLVQVLASYLMRMNEPSFAFFDIKLQVPVTLKHFQILARLGRAPVSLDIPAGLPELC